MAGVLACRAPGWPGSPAGRRDPELDLTSNDPRKRHALVVALGVTACLTWAVATSVSSPLPGGDRSGRSGPVAGSAPGPEALVRSRQQESGPGAAHLEIVQSARRRAMRPGQGNAFTLRVRNTGRTTARTVVIRERLAGRLRAVRTSRPAASSLGRARVVIRLGALRPGAATSVTVVVRAIALPSAPSRRGDAASDRAGGGMRYRPAPRLACASGTVRAANAAPRTAGACVRIRDGAPPPRITVEDREGAVPR